MKYIFVINPAAGQGKARSYWLPQIQRLVKEKELDYELHNTLSFQEGINYIRQRCESGEEIRFYGCGGDGTLNCLVNGAFGYPNASVGILPTGTGNDFVRSFTEPKAFQDLERQLEGESVALDAIKCTDPSGTKISLNMCNIGVDAAVAEVAGEMKKKPLLSGPLAYGAAAVKVLAGQIGFPARVQIDEEEAYEKEFLFIAIGNGGYCGGGFHSTPLSKLDDGLMDVCLVDKITRRKIATVIMKYRAGTHLTDKACEPVVTYRQCKKLTLTPLLSNDEHIERRVVDGEGSAFSETTFEVVPKSVNFIIPKGCEML